MFFFLSEQTKHIYSLLYSMILVIDRLQIKECKVDRINFENTVHDLTMY